MKRSCLLLLLSLTASARAENPASPTPSQTDQPTPAREAVPVHAAPRQDQELPTQIESRATETPLHIEKAAPTETAQGRLKLDGILVQLVKTDNPLQLMNPAAQER